MNFQELMSRASANKTHASKQLKKSGHHHKDSTPGVSSAAVRAFLEKKAQEQKKKQAEQEAARLARIQARLDQNLKSDEAKKGKIEGAPKSSFLNPPYQQEQKTPEVKPQLVAQKHDRHLDPGSSSSKHGSRIKSKDSSNRKPTTSNVKRKDNDKNSKEQSGKIKDFAVNGKKSEHVKRKKKFHSVPPPNFKELLAIAEQNKSGLKRDKVKTTVKKKSKCVVGVENSKTRRQQNGSREQRLTEVDKRNMHVKNKNKVKVEAKANGKQATSKQKNASAADLSKDIQRKSCEGPKTLKRTRESEALGRDVLTSKPQRSVPHYTRPPDIKHRMNQNYYSSSRPPYGGHYCDDEEDSDMDDFIDDGVDETGGEHTDVSKYIKDIFGYDRRRYANMDDFDDAAMESSFGQIEREEKRSAKIAKLEDEIDILKEQAELKKLRDKLKKSKKSKK